MSGQGVNKEPKFSSELRDGLTRFIIDELGGKVLDGITYTLIRTDDSAKPYDKQRYEEYMGLRKEANLCGFSSLDVFRVYNLQNGVIFDVDMGITKKITTLVANRVMENDGKAIRYDDVIGDKPEKRRKSDMISLAKYLNKQIRQGQRIVEVALFSRNSVPEIVINGQLADGRYAIQKYKAYAIRFWDLEDVNKNFLIPMGIRIKSVAPGAILPTRTGVLFQLELEEMTN